MQVQFHGAAGEVTGSMHLVEAAGRRVLLDCGMLQGGRALEARNSDPFPFDPAGLDALVLSHAHIDHIGRVPQLVARGFRGPVFCTRGTAALLRVMLLDAARLQEEDAARANRRGYSKHHPALPLYTAEDAEAALGLLRPHPYHQRFEVAPGVAALLRRAGHILGSATVELEIDASPALRLVYSGDLGRWGRPILRDPEPVEEADVLVVESTYGDRVHPEDAESARAHLASLLSSRGSVRILYGGSVTPENAEGLTAGCRMDGFLIGGASLSAAGLDAIARCSRP